ncbi:Gfo/Idh/MocA family oxidoreductase [Chloroflexi bacterium TSY]|nr:Gfo/Idh/MocA family oxidoreductase [Chloroflexi bacterium TSY]
MHANMFRDTLMLLEDEIELVGFYDPDPNGVRPNVKPNAQHVPFYESLDELLDKAQPDAVMISTYLRDMPNWMLQVAEAGVHVWGEMCIPASCFPSPRLLTATSCTFPVDIPGASIPLATRLSARMMRVCWANPTLSTSALSPLASYDAIPVLGTSNAMKLAVGSSTGWVVTGSI